MNYAEKIKISPTRGTFFSVVVRARMHVRGYCQEKERKTKRAVIIKIEVSKVPSPLLILWCVASRFWTQKKLLFITDGMEPRSVSWRVDVVVCKGDWVVGRAAAGRAVIALDPEME